MKYIVLTARHHDGFCLFDDGTNEFTSVKSAAHRDIVKEYVTAARAAGLGVGLYYSPLDWRFPGYLSPDVHRQSAEAMRDQYHRQMERLLSNYGKIDILFFDGGEADWLSFGGDWKGAEWKKRSAGQHYKGGFSWQHDKVYNMIRRLQPQVIFNGRADMPEDLHSREGDWAGGNFDNQHPWEHCLTLAGAWGYQKTAHPKPLKDCLHYLINAAGRDGNLLLNVGPAPDGQIDPAQAKRLREMGDWLGKYGASIYGTRGGPFLPGDYGVSTFRDKTIYVHILKWPGDKLVLPAIPAKVVRAVALTGGEVVVSQTEAGIEISVPAANRNATDTIIEIQLDQSASAIATIEVPAPQK
jgi:alpha-L-fucosidase